MTNQQILSIFAAHESSKDLSVNHLFTDGNNTIIYSYGYHFPLAKYLGVYSGKKYFAVNREKYSKTTSRHQSVLWSEITRHNGVSISVPDVLSCELSDIINNNNEVA